VIRDGVLVKDWSPTRIGGAIGPRLPAQGEGMAQVQAALLDRPKPALPEPIKVPMLQSADNLAKFLGRPPLGEVKPLKLFRK
jgi:hypothetical protein